MSRGLVRILADRQRGARGGLGVERVWRTSGDGAELLAGSIGGGHPLPASLIVPPRLYVISEATYDMTRPGLYRGSAMNGTAAWQRVVLAETSSAVGAAMIVAGLGFHGWLDNFRCFEDGVRFARRRPLLMTCGHLSGFCMRLLVNEGFEARKVEWFRSGTFNGSDDGHTMIEVFDETLGKWVCVDVDLHNVFAGEGDELLSAHEIWKAGVSSVDVRAFAGRPLSDVIGIGRVWAAPLDAVFTSDLTQDWYADVMHHVGLPDDGEIVCAGEADRGTASRRYSFVSEPLWLQRHYAR